MSGCLQRLGHNSLNRPACNEHVGPNALTNSVQWCCASVLPWLWQVPFSGYVQDVCFLPAGAAGSLPNHDNHSSRSLIDTSSNHNGSSAAAAGGSTATALDAPQQGRISSLQLVVAVRGTNCLNVLDIQLLRYARRASAPCSGAAAAAGSTDATGGSGNSSPIWRVSAAGAVNMSEAGDSHVSFSAMRLAVSPCDR